MFKIVFLFAFIPAFAFGGAIEVLHCRGVPPPKEFAIDECPQRPCNFKTGETKHLHFTIQIDKPVTALPYLFTFIRGNGEVNLVPSEYHYNACTVVEGGCPLEPGTYKFNSQVTYPDVNQGEDITYVGVMRDQDYNPITCFSVKHMANP